MRARFQTVRPEHAASVEMARLDLIADNFPTARWQMAFWAIVVLIVHAGPFPSISTGLELRQILWSAAQLGVALAFHLLLAGWPRGQETGWFGISRRSAYMTVYIANGTLWGLFPLASIHAGNLINEATVAVVLVTIVAVYSSRIAAHPAVYLSGVVSLAVVGLPCFAVAGNALVPIFTIVGPIWMAMLVGSAIRHANKIAEMVETRLENQKLAADFAAARDEARAASHAKSAFLANMSHELRTPLNAILGFSDMMRNGLFGPMDARYQEYAGDIHGSGVHLLTLINDLLDLSKIEAGKMQIEPEMIDAAETLGQVLRLMETRAEEKAQAVTLRLEPGTEEVYADSRSLKQIALNLVGNAIKFTQDQGRIEVRLRRQGQFNILSVTDNGPGIPADKLDKIFSPFERVDNSYSGAAGGTGLGLALVHALAGLHNGHARIDSDFGAGTTVTVSLPCSDDLVLRAA